MTLRSADFESAASTDSTIPARHGRVVRLLWRGRAVLLDYADVESQALCCVRCGDMLVDYAGLLDEDDISRLINP